MAVPAAGNPSSANPATKIAVNIFINCHSHHIDDGETTLQFTVSAASLKETVTDTGTVSNTLCAHTSVIRLSDPPTTVESKSTSVLKSQARSSGQRKFGENINGPSDHPNGSSAQPSSRC